jgi:hypothetical protein
MPIKFQNYIINSTANKAVFMSNTIPGSSTIKPDKTKPLKSGERNIVLNVFDTSLRSIVLSIKQITQSMADFRGLNCCKYFK